MDGRPAGEAPELGERVHGPLSRRRDVGPPHQTSLTELDGMEHPGVRLEAERDDRADRGPERLEPGADPRARGGIRLVRQPGHGPILADLAPAAGGGSGHRAACSCSWTAGTASSCWTTSCWTTSRGSASCWTTP